jgi:DNA-binding Lrp family transcriptional regulator
MPTKRKNTNAMPSTRKALAKRSPALGGPGAAASKGSSANDALDAIDEKLLVLLTRNARESATALGLRLNLSRPAIHARIKRLEAQGVIQGYTIRSRTRPRHAIRAHVLVAVEPKLHDKTISNIALMQAVEKIHTVSGEFDLIIELAATDTQTLDDVLTRIGMVPGVKRTQSSVLLSTRVDRQGEA